MQIAPATAIDFRHQMNGQGADDNIALPDLLRVQVIDNFVYFQALPFSPFACAGMARDEQNAPM